MNKILKRIIVAANDDEKDNDNEELEFDFDSMFADNDDDDNNEASPPPIEERTKSDLEQQIAGDMFNDDSSFDPYQSSASMSTTPAINGQLVQNMFLGLANEGRGVLKRIEDYKFKIIQSINLLNANPELKTKVEQKKKILESAAAQVYGIVFDLENFDLTPNYEDEQLSGESFPSFNDDNENNEEEELDLNIDSEDEEANAGESDEEIPSEGNEGGGEEGENSKNMDLGDMDMDLELPPAEESEE